MLTNITHHRSGLIAAGVAVAAFLPGTWGTAVAQTAGPAATPVVTTTPEGTVTVTTAPNGTVTTLVETTRGTVTVVQAPGQPVQVAVAPLDQTVDTTLTVGLLATTFDVPGGTLGAGELITMVESSLTPSFPSFLSHIDIDTARIAYAANIGASGTTLITPEAAAEPGEITAIRAFELAVQKADGTAGQIAKPIRMTWDFSAENLSAAGGDPANLLMLGYDEATEAWTPAEQVAYTSTSVTFEVPHFSLWAFAVRSPGPPRAGCSLARRHRDGCR